MKNRNGVIPDRPDTFGHQSQAVDNAGGRSARSFSEDGAPPANAPPLVIRGKSCRASVDPDTGEQVYLVEDHRGEWIPVSGRHALTHAYAAITDWLNFTFQFDVRQNPLDEFLPRLMKVLGRRFVPARERPYHMQNYDRCFELGEGIKSFFCFGGVHQRGTAFMSLSGFGCALILDWQRLVEFGRDELKGRITRWDGAVDDYAGVHSVEEALQLYEQGKFNAGGRDPRCKQHGAWRKPDGTGRTVTIGRRENGKRLNAYEKGMELGCPGHPWVRWEVTLGNKGRIIPWEILLEPGRYVVGAYPKALSWVQEEMTRIRTLQKQTQIGYEAAVAHAKKQFGPTLNLVVKVTGSPEKAVELLRRDGLPKRVRHPAVDDPEGWIE